MVEGPALGFIQGYLSILNPTVVGFRANVSGFTLDYSKEIGIADSSHGDSRFKFCLL